MGTISISIEQILSAANDAKLHGGLCMKLGRLVYKVIKIFPDLEAVQPRCMPGIQSLCSLHLAIDKAASLLRHCAECSKLYLAVTGESILLKFIKIKDALYRSLCDLETMVPRNLARQIAEIVEELVGTTFAMEPTEKEIGDDIIALLHQSSGGTNNNSELEVFRQATDRLGIVSPRSVLSERRALKKQLDKAQAEDDQRKASVIHYFLHLLRKCDKRFSYEYLDDDSSNSNFQSRRKSASDVNTIRKTDRRIAGMNLMNLATKQTNKSLDGIPIPPEEFRCPISLQLMSDPVVISSGQTYERVCIEKWFNDGHETCPKTQQKLSHLSVTPNYCIKALITSWCEKNGIQIADPVSQSPPTSDWSLDLFHMNDDCEKGVKLTSLGDNQVARIVEEEGDNIPGSHFSASFCCASPSAQERQGSNEISDPNVSWPYDVIDSDASDEDGCIKYERLRTSLMTPPLESQCQAVEMLKRLSEEDDKAPSCIGSNGLIPALVSFLQSATDASDIKAQKTGALALSSIAKNDRNAALIISAGALPLLLDLIRSEAIEFALAVLLPLSKLDENKTSIIASGAIPPLLELLDSNNKHFQCSALNVLHNLSTITQKWPNIMSIRSVSNLVCLLNDTELTNKCIAILYNLAGTEEGRATIAETEGCIMAISELLDTGSLEEQEQAAGILFLLCTNSVKHNELVLREGVIPSLVTVSVNGSLNGREKAQKLLEHFREERFKNYSWRGSSIHLSSLETSFAEEESPSETRNEKDEQVAMKTNKKRKFFSKLSFLFPPCGSQ